MAHWFESWYAVFTSQAWWELTWDKQCWDVSAEEAADGSVMLLPHFLCCLDSSQLNTNRFSHLWTRNTGTPCSGQHEEECMLATVDSSQLNHVGEDWKKEILIRFLQKWIEHLNGLLIFWLWMSRVTQRGGGCPIPGDIQGQVGWGSEQPALAVGVAVHCRGVGLEGTFRGTFQLKWFYDSMLQIRKLICSSTSSTP